MSWELTPLEVLGSLPTKPYVLFEGFDGTGKTTALCRVRDTLTARGIESYASVAPSWNRLGSTLRQDLSDPTICSNATPFVFVADQICIEDGLRAHWNKMPVLQDRHCLVSGPSYNPEGWALEGFFPFVEELFFPPDITVLLVAPVSVIQARLEERKEKVPSAERIAEVSARLHELAHRLSLVRICDTSEMAISDVEKAVVADIEGLLYRKAN